MMGGWRVDTARCSMYNITGKICDLILYEIIIEVPKTIGFAIKDAVYLYNAVLFATESKQNSWCVQPKQPQNGANSTLKT